MIFPSKGITGLSSPNLLSASDYFNPNERNTMKVKLAEALLRRKELNDKVQQLHQIKSDAFFEMRIERIKVTDSLDEVRAHVPFLKANEITQEYDYYAGQLRKLDASIQNANWVTEIDVDDKAMTQFTEQ